MMEGTSRCFLVSQTYEGKWEEIARDHGSELAGQRVRLTVLEKTAEKPVPAETNLAEAMKDFIGCASSGKPSNLAERVDEAFGEIMDEEQRKWNKHK
jgi:hypothetical protein